MPHGEAVGVARFREMGSENVKTHTGSRPAGTDETAGFEAFQLVGAGRDDEYDLLAKLAAEACGTPMAGITFITRARQHFKSSVGLSLTETSRDHSFCQYTIDSDSPVVVPDATQDDRFQDSPLVTGDTDVRFYAGAPLRAEDGSSFGALCVMDSQPRQLGREELNTLEGLARQATTLIQRRLDRERLARMASAIDHHGALARVFSWEWNAEHDETTASPRLFEMFGMDPDSSSAYEAFMERIHPLDRPRVERFTDAALADGAPFAYRARFVLPGGEVGTFDTQGEPLTDAAGTVVGLRGATVDVTDLVRAEIKSREQAMGLYAAFDTALDPILVVNEERRYAHANRAACAMFGYEREELLGMLLEDLVPASEHEQARKIWDAFLKRGELRGEIDLRRRDGTTLVAEYSATADFVPNRHLVVLRDMTERLQDERRLRESNLRLENTQALAKVGSWEWDLRGELAITSNELLRMLGRPQGSPPPSYQEFAEYVHPEDRESYDRIAVRALQDKQPFHQVFRIVSESGEIRTIESHGQVEVDEQGEPVRMLGAAQDITDRERAEAEIRMQANVLHQLPAGIIASDTDRRIYQWNRGAEKIFGISAEDAIEKYVDDLGLIPPESQEAREEMMGTVASGRTWEGEIELVGPGGRIFPALVTNSPTRNQRGDVVGYIGVTVDLSDQRMFESELLVQGQLLDQVGAAVIGLDPERRVTHWNRGAETLSGWRRREAVGRTLPEIGLLDGDAQGPAAARGEMTAGGSWEGELEMTRKDGSSFPTLTSVSPTRDPKGELTGFVGVAVDISARKRAEEEARRARHETLTRLSRAVETRDRETGDHIERIGDISAMLAERLGLEPELVELIRVSSPMHDVGKIGIPDEILLKKGKLTAEERSEMERHAQFGHDILAGTGTELLDMAAVIALTHHERVDGNGYPQGLSGDEIPIEGRIVAVADVFDALTSDRVYREAMSTETAVRIMREGRGSHFDAEVLDALLDDLDAFLAVKGRGPEIAS